MTNIDNALIGAFDKIRSEALANGIPSSQIPTPGIITASLDGEQEDFKVSR